MQKIWLSTLNKINKNTGTKCLRCGESMIKFYKRKYLYKCLYCGQEILTKTESRRNDIMELDH